MPIPLLRLPLLPFEEVIQSMRSRELFVVSFCSKRMNLVVKNLRRKSFKLTVSLGFGKAIEINLLKENQPYHSFRLTVKAKPKTMSKGWRVEKFEGTLFREGPFLRSCWEDVDGGAKSLLGYMSDLFCAPIRDLSINGNRYLWMLDWVEERQAPRSYQAFINDRRNGLTDEQFRHLLVDRHPSYLHVTTSSEDFRVENSPGNYQAVTLLEGTWLTIENLLTIDCNRLKVYEPAFTVTEMNRFLRHLLVDGGALPRLADFEAHLQNSDENETILEGVREALAPIPGKEQFEVKRSSWKFSGRPKKGRAVLVSIECFGKIVCFKRF